MANFSSSNCNYRRRAHVRIGRTLTKSQPEWDFCHKASWNDAIRLNSTGRCLSTRTFAIGGCKIDLRQMICARANQVSLCKYTHTHAHIRASCNDFTFIPSERLQSRAMRLTYCDTTYKRNRRLFYQKNIK